MPTPTSDAILAAIRPLLEERRLTPHAVGAAVLDQRTPNRGNAWRLGGQLLDGRARLTPERQAALADLLGVEFRIGPGGSVQVIRVEDPRS